MQQNWIWELQNNITKIPALTERNVLFLGIQNMFVPSTHDP